MKASSAMTFCFVLITCLGKFILARSPPHLTVKETNKQQIVRPGVSITLECPVKHSKDVIFEWYKDKESVVTFGSKRLRVLSNGSLRIRNTVYDDTGIYKCRAVNGFGSVEYNTTLLVIGNEEDYEQYEAIYDPEESIEDESSKIPITSKPQILYVNDKSPVLKPLGSSFMLQCVATGFPKPEIMWYKNGVPISSQYRIGRWALKFTKALSTDTGNYTCVAANALGKSSHFFVLEVGEPFRNIRGKPLITGSNQTVEEGDVVVMECGVESASSPHIEWLKQVSQEKANLYPGKHAITMEGESYYVLTKPFSVDYLLKDGIYYPKLTIENVQLEDAGKYVCLGANTYGYDFHFTYLEVIPKYRDNQPVSFPIVVTVVVVALAVLGCITAMFFYCRPRPIRQRRIPVEDTIVTKDGFIPMHSAPTNVIKCPTNSTASRSSKPVTYVSGVSTLIL